jgi:glycosyltransferase involved in cell wall biosynthesis
MRPSPTFSLLVPTRARTPRLRRLLDSLLATARDPRRIEVVLVVDEDDPESVAFHHDGLPLTRVVVPPGRPMGELNALGYEASSGDYVMLLNDDVVARTPGWDEVVLRRLRDFPDGVVLIHVNDTLLRDHLCAFPIVSRAFCELGGGLCPREYQRYRIDDHIEDIFNLLAALGERRTVYLPDVVFEHHNAVVLADGTREYHSDPAVLALDAPRFLRLFPRRKEIALRLLEHIECRRWQARAKAARRRLAEIDDPFSLRVPGRQLGSPGPRPLAGFLQRLRRCWDRNGARGLVQAIHRRLTRSAEAGASPPRAATAASR